MPLEELSIQMNARPLPFFSHYFCQKSHSEFSVAAAAAVKRNQPLSRHFMAIDPSFQNVDKI